MGESLHWLTDLCFPFCFTNFCPWRLCYVLLLSQHLNFLLMGPLGQEFWNFFFTQGLIWWELLFEASLIFHMCSHFFHHSSFFFFICTWISWHGIFHDVTCSTCCSLHLHQIHVTELNDNSFICDQVHEFRCIDFASM